MVKSQFSKLAMRVRFPLPAPFMNVSHKYKTVLWLPQRTASRSIAPLFHDYNFINAEFFNPIDGYEKYSHILSIPPGCEQYDVICSVRNPYSWLLSIWHWDNFFPDVAEKDRISYAEFVENRSSDLEGIMDNILKVEIKYLIKYESIKESILKIPWFNSYQLDFNLEYNGNMSENLIRCSDNKNFSDYLKHYTKKELDIVNNKFSALFDKLGYLKYDKNCLN